MVIPKGSKFPPLLSIKNATFYREHPASLHPSATTRDTNPPLFPDLSFNLSHNAPSIAQHWAVVSPSSSSRSTFLQILRGQHLCFPPTARSYPSLTNRASDAATKDKPYRSPSHAIQYVGFDAQRSSLGSSTSQGTYLSARYESRREKTDFSVMDYLKGNMELNPAEDLKEHVDTALLDKVIADLHLDRLLSMPVTNLSNGQTRRAMIAKALLGEPELLLVDGPFMGLDPHTVRSISALLGRLAEACSPSLLLSLRPQDYIPDWITHLVYTSPHYQATYQGERHTVFQWLAEAASQVNEIDKASVDDQALVETASQLSANIETANTKNVEEKRKQMLLNLFELGSLKHSKIRKNHDPVLNLSPKQIETYLAFALTWKYSTITSLFQGLDWTGARFTRDGYWPYFSKLPVGGEPLVEMEGVKVKYGDTVALGGWQQDVAGEAKDGLWWKVRRGQRWGVFGPNGSGKTTLLALLTSDHPQAYSVPLKLFGRTRLPKPGQPGISLFELQSKIGHSSPEIHSLFPKHLTVRQALESAWADTPLSKPRLTPTNDEDIEETLAYFTPELQPGWSPPESEETIDPDATMESKNDAKMVQADPQEEVLLEETDDGELDEELNDDQDGEIDEDDPEGKNHDHLRYHHLWNNPITYQSLRRGNDFDEQLQMSSNLEWVDQVRFSELSFSAQRLLLFLRAVLSQPSLVVLDEAFSGMDASTLDMAMEWLSWGPLKTTMRQSIYQLCTRKSNWHHKQIDIDYERDGLKKKGRFAGLTEEQALIVVSHRADEVPGCVREWITLPEPGTGSVRMGSVSGPVEGGNRWEWIWGVGKPGIAEKEGWDAVERKEELDIEEVLMNNPKKLQKLRKTNATKRDEMHRSRKLGPKMIDEVIKGGGTAPPIYER